MTGQAALDAALLERAGARVREVLGLHFPAGRLADLGRGLLAAAREERAADPADFVRGLLAGPLPGPVQRLLARHLTVGETYFFRDPAVFELLAGVILPERVAARRAAGGGPLLLWSAACSSGEEAYSMAATALQAVPPDPGFEVLATDLNEDALERARAGRYRPWSVRQLPPASFGAWAEVAQDRSVRVGDELRRRVRFRRLNLADGAYPPPLDRDGAADVIFCRNVFIYFDAALLARVVGRLAALLAPDGWLLVAAAETSSVEHPLLEGAWEHGIRVFRKRPARAPGVAAPAARRPAAAPVPRPAPPSAPGPAPATPAPPPPPPPAPAGPSLDEALAAGDADAAGRLLDLAPAAERTVERLLALAGLRADRGDMAGAEQCCRAALERDDLHPGAHLDLAALVAEAGRREEAVALLRRALYLERDSIPACFRLGVLLGPGREGRRFLERTLGLLARLPDDTPLPRTGGLAAGGLRRTVRGILDGPARP